MEALLYLLISQPAWKREIRGPLHAIIHAYGCAFGLCGLHRWGKWDWAKHRSEVVLRDAHNFFPTCAEMCIMHNTAPFVYEASYGSHKADSAKQNLWEKKTSHRFWSSTRFWFVWTLLQKGFPYLKQDYRGWSFCRYSVRHFSDSETLEKGILHTYTCTDRDHYFIGKWRAHLRVQEKRMHGGGGEKPF